MAAAHRAREGEQTPPAPTVMSLTKYIPYPGVAHAGGHYLLSHYRAIQSRWSIEQLAPNIPLNRQALRRPGLDELPPAELLPGPRLGGAGFALQRFESIWAGSSIYRPVRRLFRGARAPWRRLAAARVVELQWSEMIALAPSIRRMLPEAVLIGIAHDVIVQRWERLSKAGGSAHVALFSRIAAARARRREAKSFAALNVLVVFSEKDAALARALAPATRVEIVHPGLGPAEPVRRATTPESPSVLFTGAMNRPENVRAVSWFAERIWPTIAAAVPTARLVVAGASPPEQLGAQLRAAPRTTLTGFVDSLEPFYAEASVCVVPLITGAGVKFKTVDAMLRGVPVVSTAVGAEGIDAPEHFAAITDDPEAFAAAVIEVLRSEGAAERAAEAARQWAEGVYGTAAFERRIGALYGELIDG